MSVVAEQESEFVRWADSELRRAGLFDKDSDYEGMMGESIMELVRKFSDAGHSGFSAAMAASIFGQLSQYRPLGPLTDDPGEWMHIADDMAGNATTWQSRRAPACFSDNGGGRYYDVEELPSRLRKVARRVSRRRLLKWHRTVSRHADTRGGR